MPSHQLGSKLNRDHASVLVVQRSDHRFQGGFYEFLNLTLNLHGNYDLLALPGGPQSLTLVEYLPKFAWASWKWFRFLLERHGLKRMIPIAHQDCAWYRDLPFHLHASRDARTRQVEDLQRQRARRVLEKEFPWLSVEPYYAGWGADDRITIEAIPS